MIHRVLALWPSRDSHLPHRDLGISMGSPVAVEPSEKRLPSRTLVSGALTIIASWRPEVSAYQDLAEIIASSK